MRTSSLVALLLLGAAVTWIGCGAANPEVVELDAAGVPVLPEEDGTKRITPEQVAWLRQEGVPLLLVDSRTRDAHAEGRPQGSVNVPLDMTELAASKMPSDRLIVTLCT